MTNHLKELGRALSKLALQLNADGWNHSRVGQLIELATQVAAESRQIAWIEAADQAETVASALREFRSHAPIPERLAALLGSVSDLAALLRQDAAPEWSGRQLERLREAVYAHAIVSIAAVDGTITEANPKFCEISGYRREELIGCNHRIVRSGHHPPAFFEEMWATIAAGRIWQGEIQNRRKDGGAYWVQTTIVPFLGENGAPEQYISVRTDITRQKQLQTDKERQGRLLDLLLQTAQHYLIRQNLADAAARLLEGMLLLTDSAYGFIGEALRDADGALYLRTHAITHLAWDEATQRLYDDHRARGLEFRNLNNLFGAVLHSGEPVIANAPANDPRQGDLPNGLPALTAFLGAPVYQGKTLVGMVGLANRPGGYAAEQIAFLAPLTSAYAALMEADRLRGSQQSAIDELVLARDAAEQIIGEQMQALMNARYELRTRLNTVLCYAQLLLINHEADETVCEPAQHLINASEQCVELIDSRFDFVDRTAAAKTQAQPADFAPVVSRVESKTQRRILVAEDNPANQALLRMQLMVLGCEADIAANGAAALSRWQAGGYDLILADRQMPGMDGLELTRSIRAAERESGGHAPVIAITAASDAEGIAACRAAGFDDVLSKPIDLETLRQMLQRWLPITGVYRPSPPLPLLDPLRIRVLDSSCLVRSVGDVTPQQARDLVDLFTRTAWADLPVCREHLRRGEGYALALAMHKLKSAARAVGALCFADLAEALEAVAQSDALHDAARLLTGLEQALTDVEAAVAALTWEQAAFHMDSPAAAIPYRCALIVDDDAVVRQQLELLMKALGVAEVLAAPNGRIALDRIAGEGQRIELLLCDLHMPEMDGVEFIRRLGETGYAGNLILISGVETRLLQTVSDLARLQKARLLGSLRKPVTRDTLSTLLLTAQGEASSVRVAQPAQVTADDLLEGLRADEFAIHFQPKVEAASLRVVGMEALARWRRRSGLLIPPNVFIEVAEQHQLIGALSMALMTKAFAGTAHLARAGFPLSVAVNLSARWLSDLRLPELILDSVCDAGLQAEQVILEITETGIMADLTTALDVLTRLRLKGFRLAIDDFGTGYSSLEQLRRIPFSEVKLDRGFVRGAFANETARAILAFSVDMARKLKLSTVAEGVETEDDLDLVRGLGCDLVQGWLVAKAMPVDLLIEWLRGRSL